MSETNPSDFITRRICLRLSGMEAVTVRRDVEYRATDAGPLTMDLYYPPEGQDSDRLPAVIIVPGYSGAMTPRVLECTYKELGWTVSMAQLIAASGLVAIAYTNRDPEPDLQRVFDHVRQHTVLRIDGTRVGVVAVSGNVPTALSTLMRDARHTPRCAVFGYGFMLDLDGSHDVADAAAQWRFDNPCAGKTVADMRQNVPMFVARAGRDQFPGVNASIDRFLAKAVDANLPLTFVNHPDGPHAFDLFDDSIMSREIVRQALRFLQCHLVS